VPCKQCRDFIDARDDAIGEARLAKRRFHSRAHGLPGVVADDAVDAAVGDDFHVAIGQQQIDEHAGVLVGVPDAQEAEYLERALARRQLAHDAQRR
jgi:hypothetical protein